MIDSRRYLIDAIEPVDLDDAALRKEVIKAQTGDDFAMSTVISAVIKRIHWLAVQYHRFDLLEDLVQEGCIGVVTAVERFDADKAGKSSFVSYATLWAKSRMMKTIRASAAMRGPVTVVSLDDDTSSQYGDDMHLRVPSYTPTPAAICRQLDDRDELQRLLMAISDHEREAITGVFGLGGEKTKSMDVASVQGVSKNAVTNRVKRGVEKMRQIALAGGGTP